MFAKYISLHHKSNYPDEKQHDRLQSYSIILYFTIHCKNDLLHIQVLWSKPCLRKHKEVCTYLGINIKITFAVQKCVSVQYILWYFYMYLVFMVHVVNEWAQLLQVTLCSLISDGSKYVAGHFSRSFAQF